MQPHYTSSGAANHPITVYPQSATSQNAKNTGSAFYKNHALSTLSPHTIQTDVSQSSVAPNSPINSGGHSIDDTTYREAVKQNSNVPVKQVSASRGPYEEYLGAANSVTAESKKREAAREMQAQLPCNSATIETNKESDGIFDYYKRSVSEAGYTYNGAQNQSRHRNGATSSYLSAQIYNQSTQQPPGYQTSSFILAGGDSNGNQMQQIQRNSALEGSVMLDQNLLAERMASGTP